MSSDPTAPQLLETVVQHYSWGSRTLIPALLGLPAPAAEPWAELWVGAHPGGPSRLPDGRSLAEVEPDLPVPAQAAQCRRAAVPPGPPGRGTGPGRLRPPRRPPRSRSRRRTGRTRTPNAKPEMLVALTPFDALCGFRHPEDARRLVAGLECPELAPLLDALGDPDPAVALRRAFTLEMLGVTGSERAVRVLSAAAGSAAARAASPDTDTEDSIVYGWLARLAVTHLGDASALAPLLLNVIHLEPGTGVFLPARHLHAYLAGAGVEVMGNSDNVVRGGLTPKHVDVERLLDVVEFAPQPVPVVRPRRIADGVDAYDVPVSEFVLYRAHVLGAPVTLQLTGPRVVLSTAGVVEVWDVGGSVSLRPGRAATSRPAATT